MSIDWQHAEQIADVLDDYVQAIKRAIRRKDASAAQEARDLKERLGWLIQVIEREG